MKAEKIKQLIRTRISKEREEIERQKKTIWCRFKLS